MRALIVAAALSASILSVPALAQAPAHPAADAPAHYSTSDTDVGTLLDDPAARAIVDKYIPGFSSGEQVDMARSLTLRSLQQYAPDRMSDAILAQIDNDLAKLPVKK
jgi:hypothetical protein